MFNEKNITEALDRLSTLFGSIDKSEYSEGNDNYGLPVIDRSTEEIAQALMSNVETVCQFNFCSSRMFYAAKDLFGKRACFLMDRLLEFDDADDTNETIEHLLELWLLEDMQIAVVECFKVDDSFCSVAHRSIRCMVEDAHDLQFNPLEYYHQLECMYQDWERSGRKIYRF